MGLSPMQWAHGRYNLRRKPSPPQSFLWDRVGGVAWCRTEPLVQWSGLLPNRNKKPRPPSPQQCSTWVGEGREAEMEGGARGEKRLPSALTLLPPSFRK